LKSWTKVLSLDSRTKKGNEWVGSLECSVVKTNVDSLVLRAPLDRRIFDFLISLAFHGAAVDCISVVHQHTPRKQGMWLDGAMTWNGRIGLKCPSKGVTAQQVHRTLTVGLVGVVVSKKVGVCQTIKKRVSLTKSNRSSSVRTKTTERKFFSGSQNYHHVPSFCKKTHSISYLLRKISTKKHTINPNPKHSNRISLQVNSILEFHRVPITKPIKQTKNPRGT
jgi:hypothetical protein